MKIKNVVVGAGYAGSVTARRLAEEKNEKVLVIDKHNHIAGHAHDQYNEYGVLIHTYGPHIFHTNNKKVWDWLSRFTDWYLYQHRVLSYIDGMKIPMPISAETINQLYNLNLSSDEVERWLEKQAEHIDEIKTSEDVVISKAGRDIYEKFFKNYTYKQWDRYPDELDPSVIKRIPFRNNRDTRYFTDKYQGLPKQGYTKMFEKILDHPNIHIMLNANWLDIKDQIQYDKLYFTGPIDLYYDYKFGALEYRSVRFEYETFFNKEFYQEVGTVNYPNDYDFTRITEYKHLTGQNIPYTTIAKEYSMAHGEPFYIVPDKENQDKAEQYRQYAQKEKNVTFIGRLAEYKYYNMDQIVDRALELPLD
ncbi:UDP-galactopyranose mutase [Defluviitalea raffinosedens]|uniref:UDP-galactopyranose mutase n=1 Tax=Defluviitalea raffinosedens TaxID=1450156 RepID=A0A7C8LLG2_9FIRM|nr:UDP-galactopyranose mutase [Defluviitalea raffinosedens]KAE9635587.1 UDP-galactopyranose mutase [Defluviitalea raffinosedens]